MIKHYLSIKLATTKKHLYTLLLRVNLYLLFGKSTDYRWKLKPPTYSDPIIPIKNHTCTYTCMLPVTLSSNSSLHFRLLKQNIKVLDFFFPLEVRMGTCFTINLVDTNDSIFFFFRKWQYFKLRRSCTAWAFNTIGTDKLRVLITM